MLRFPFASSPTHPLSQLFHLTLPRRLVPVDHVTQVPSPSGFLLGPASGRRLLIKGRRPPSSVGSGRHASIFSCSSTSGSCSTWPSMARRDCRSTRKISFHVSVH